MFNKLSIKIITIILLIIVFFIFIKNKITEKIKLLGVNSSNKEIVEIDKNIKIPYIDEPIIIMWNGSISAIPRGWALCDGTTKNNIQTPDLRGRFIVGATTSRQYSSNIVNPTTNSTINYVDSNYTKIHYNTHDKGGLDFPALKEDQMPKHNHNAISHSSKPSTHLANSSDGGNLWQYINTPENIRGGINSNNTTTYSVATSLDSNSKLVIDDHNFNKSTLYKQTKPFDNRPPYYALAYIMYVGT